MCTLFHLSSTIVHNMISEGTQTWEPFSADRYEQCCFQDGKSANWKTDLKLFHWPLLIQYWQIFFFFFYFSFIGLYYFFFLNFTDFCLNTTLYCSFRTQRSQGLQEVSRDAKKLLKNGKNKSSGRNKDNFCHIFWAFLTSVHNSFDYLTCWDLWTMNFWILHDKINSRSILKSCSDAFLWTECLN